VLDPQVSGRVLAQLAEAGADYTSNVDPRSWPKGLDTEAFTREALESTAAEATEAYDREHVTPYMRRAAGFVRANTALADDRYADWRWTLDYPQDLEFLRALLGRAGPEPERAGFEDLKRLVEADPALPRINAHLT
jgi:spore coat polysaccharide biosynthesis protein SpsF (cytidylyltransferase family)